MPRSAGCTCVGRRRAHSVGAEVTIALGVPAPDQLAGLMCHQSADVFGQRIGAGQVVVKASDKAGTLLLRHNGPMNVLHLLNGESRVLGRGGKEK